MDLGHVPPLTADQARLGQVFLNLLINAAHAIPAGAPDEHRIVVRTRAEDADRAVVEISDTGCGIPPEVLPRIFDPFFTTKESGAGTGLGLSICVAIVKDLQGEITVESRVGRGTTFRVAFPLSRGSRPTGDPVPLAARRARILVIDDERTLARALGRMLREHDVHLALGGGEGLERLRAEDFDVVFCDLIMPGVTGMDLYYRLLHEREDVARDLVFMTGGAYGGPAQSFLEGLENDVMEKPFRAEQLRSFLAGRLAEIDRDR